jgi:hypothetical protein
MISPLRVQHRAALRNASGVFVSSRISIRATLNGKR